MTAPVMRPSSRRSETVHRKVAGGLAQTASASHVPGTSPGSTGWPCEEWQGGTPPDSIRISASVGISRSWKIRLWAIVPSASPACRWNSFSQAAFQNEIRQVASNKK